MTTYHTSKSRVLRLLGTTILALAAPLALVLPSTVAGASSPSGVTFTGAPTGQLQPANYTVAFTPTTALAAADTVSASFPAGFDLSSASVALATGFSGTCQSPVTNLSSNTISATLPAGCSLAAATSAAIVVSSVVNPVAGSYAGSGFALTTSTDTTPVASSAPVVVTTNIDAPTISHAGSGAALVSFNADGVATSYQVSSTPGAFTCAVANATAPTGPQSCSIVGLTNGTSYTFVVTPSGGSTTSTPSPASQSFIPGAALSTPRLSTAGPTGVGVSFLADGVATTYTVNSYQNGTLQSATGNSCVVANSTTPPTGAQFCYLTNLAASTAYTVVVTPSGGSTSSLASSPASITTSAALSTPTVALAGPGAVKVSFVADGAATTYTVSSSPAGSSCTVTASTAPTGPQACTVTGLTNGTGYTFSVAPSGGTTQASTSPASLSITPTTALAAPTAAPSGPGAVRVTFTADGSSTLYTVAASPGNFTCSIANTQTPPTGTQSCVVTGLADGTYYTFTVTNSSATVSPATSPASAPVKTLTRLATPTVADTGSGQVTVSFTPDSVTTSYLVTAYLASNNTLAAPSCSVSKTPAATTTQTCVVTGLTNGLSYAFVVSPATVSMVSYSSLASLAITPGAPLAQPTVASAGPGKALVSFLADGVSTLYTVTTYQGSTQVTSTGATCFVANTQTPLTGTQSCVISGLTNGLSYTFVVTPSGNQTPSLASPASASFIVSSALSTPVATNAGSGAAKVTFTADGLATTYLVTSYLGTTQGPTCSVANTSVAPSGAQSCVISGLTNGSTYTFSVTPSGGSTLSTVSPASAPLLIGVAPLATPTVTFAAPTGTQAAAKVTFTADGVATTYLVTSYLGTIQGPTCSVANSTTTPSGTQSCVISGLTPGLTYTFTVTPSGGSTTSLTSAPSAPYTASLDTAPLAPTSLVAVSSMNSVKVTWTAPASNGGSAITSYLVTATHNTTTISCPSVSASATSCVISGLTPGVTYQISVKAVNASGSSLALAGSAVTLARPVALRVVGVAFSTHPTILRVIGRNFATRPHLVFSQAHVRYQILGETSSTLTIRMFLPRNAPAGVRVMVLVFASSRTAVHYLQRR